MIERVLASRRDVTWLLIGRDGDRFAREISERSPGLADRLVPTGTLDADALSGIGVLKLDGRFVVTEVLFILAWRVVGMIGVQQLLVRGLWAVRHGLHPVPQPVPVPVRRLHVRRRR